MLSTPHILVGAAIVKAIPNPYISLPLAFLSHFLFDFIPHWDFKIALKPKPLLSAFADYTIGLTLLYVISADQLNQPLLILGGILATVPDFMMGSVRVLHWQIFNLPPLNHLNNFHMDIQNRVNVFWGSIFSVLTALISIYILVN